MVGEPNAVVDRVERSPSRVERSADGGTPLARLRLPRISLVTGLAVSVVLVMIVELLNTGIETAIDRIGPEWHALSKRAKDMASAAVFLAFLNCLAVWAIIILANWHRIKTLEFLRWPPQFLP